jgi:hypothetical protein
MTTSPGAGPQHLAVLVFVIAEAVPGRPVDDRPTVAFQVLDACRPASAIERPRVLQVRLAIADRKEDGLADWLLETIGDVGRSDSIPLGNPSISGMRPPMGSRSGGREVSPRGG